MKTTGIKACGFRLPLLPYVIYSHEVFCPLLKRKIGQFVLIVLFIEDSFLLHLTQFNFVHF